MAIPCDGILECRDGRDENCDDDKLILIISVALLFITTICNYLYLVCVRLQFWKNSVFRDFDNGKIDLESRHSDCIDMKGTSLAKLKVFIAIFFMSLQNICENSFRMMHHKNNVLRHWLWKEFSPKSRKEFQSMHQEKQNLKFFKRFCTLIFQKTFWTYNSTIIGPNLDYVDTNGLLE